MAELKKTMGFWMVASISFLNLVNTGIFFGAQVGASAAAGGMNAGIDSIFAWCILAVLSVYIAMCFAELTSMFPTAGGVYEFTKQGYGRFPSFLIAWSVWVTGNIATALFTVAAANYLFPTTDLFIMGVYISPPLFRMLVCILAIVTLNYIAYRGIEASARFNILLSVFMILVMAFVIFTGFNGFSPAHFTGFTFRTGLILLSIFFLSETFFGWEAASYMSEETEDAEHVIPRAIVATAVTVAVFALLLTLVLFGALGTAKILDPTMNPIIAMLSQDGVSATLLVVVNIGIVAALLGNVSGNVVGLPRLLLAMSRDKLFIEQFSDIHPRRQTPYKAIILQTIVAVLIALVATATYERLLELIVPVSLFTYGSTILLIPYFRWKRPQQPRPFKAPLGRILPFFVALFFLLLLLVWVFPTTLDTIVTGHITMAAFIPDPNAVGQLRLLFSFLLFSAPIYLLLTYFYDPDSLIGTLGFFSRLNLWLENILVPKRIRREVAEMFHHAEGKHVLEFGSGVGTLTVHIAEHVGKTGKVYAVGISKSDVNILQKRMTKLGHTHVEVIHDPHLINRVHPSIKYVDMIVSIGHLGYIQDVKKVLREMNAVLPRLGHVFFVEYIDLFYFLPNPKWLSSPETIKQVFAEAGFNVTVKVRRSLFWKYLYIYGIKDSHGTVYI